MEGDQSKLSLERPLRECGWTVDVTGRPRDDFGRPMDVHLAPWTFTERRSHYGRSSCLEVVLWCDQIETVTQLVWWQFDCQWCMYETWPISWHHPFVICWTIYRLALPQWKLFVGLRDRTGEYCHCFRHHWQTHLALPLVARISLPLGLCNEAVKESNTTSKHSKAWETCAYSVGLLYKKLTWGKNCWVATTYLLFVK